MSAHSKSLRTCVVSRERHPPDAMVRLGLDDQGRLCVKREGGGRSAWVLPHTRLLQKLEAKPGMVRRSLRRAPRRADGLVVEVAQLLADRVAVRLRAAWRSGQVRCPGPGGSTPVAVLVAWQPPTDEVEGQMLPWDAAGVGCLLGRPRITTLVAFESRPTRALRHELRLWHELGYSAAPLTAPSL